MHPYQRRLRKNAKVQPSQLSDAHNSLWQRIRRKQILGLSFYNQKSLLGHAVDFYCPAARLVVELERTDDHQPEAYRTMQDQEQRLTEMGIKVLRFDQLQVLTDLEAVLAELSRAVRQRLKSIAG
ncbi:endonuclease domain-containing protein [Bowmanella dokdonensis]|uniref:DUF559 domain-containing protein n=1 Tax=Bowmanella dokdonensis TaxID=751969 RepID=A0A939DNP0_9ALTE|nr:DUF559 domain-containing protein [Bowmanella dokdonensis]MBN7826129.1 DUF559 domain-containing protein [Bowmanella dokdonensis]